VYVNIDLLELTDVQISYLKFKGWEMNTYKHYMWDEKPAKELELLMDNIQIFIQEICITVKG
jgi:hypothetical protein